MGRVGRRSRVVRSEPVPLHDDTGHTLALLTLACGHHVLRRRDALRPVAGCGMCRPVTLARGGKR